MTNAKTGTVRIDTRRPGLVTRLYRALDVTLGFSLGEGAVRVADLPDGFADADVVSAKVCIFALLEGDALR
jgi:hypothetical protein